MPIHRVDDLTGAALDAAVAQCQGLDFVWHRDRGCRVGSHERVYVPSADPAEIGRVMRGAGLPVLPGPYEDVMRRYVRKVAGDEIELPNEAVIIAGEYVGPPIGAVRPRKG